MALVPSPALSGTSPPSIFPPLPPTPPGCIIMAESYGVYGVLIAFIRMVVDVSSSIVLGTLLDAALLLLLLLLCSGDRSGHLRHSHPVRECNARSLPRTRRGLSFWYLVRQKLLDLLYHLSIYLHNAAVLRNPFGVLRAETLAAHNLRSHP